VSFKTGTAPVTDATVNGGRKQTLSNADASKPTKKTNQASLTAALLRDRLTETQATHNITITCFSCGRSMIYRGPQGRSVLLTTVSAMV
jgi:hypothetical protein